MARKGRDPADTITPIPSSFLEERSDSYSKYTFYVSLIILLLLIAVLGFAFMKGGLPVKIR